MSSDSLPFETLRQQAFHLPLELRNELAHDLLDSVKAESGQEVGTDDEDFVAEIERRSAEARSGAVVLTDWEESVKRVEEKLRRNAAQ